MAAPQAFVCLDCRSVIERPDIKNGILRCPSGHRVQGIKARPLWQIGVLSSMIAFWILSVVIHLFQTVRAGAVTPIVVWGILLLSGAWSAYIGFRGIGLAKTS